jgi:glycosyl transferase family 25
MLPVQVINLVRRPERLRRIGAALDAAGIRWEPIDAIDAQSVSHKDLSTEFGSGWRRRAFPATLGDMACSLTHQLVWKKIADSGQAAIVLEDDAVLADSFGEFLSPDIVAAMREAALGVLKLEYWPGEQKSRRFPVGVPLRMLHGPSQRRLYRMRSSFLGSCAYLMRPESAELSLFHHPKLCVPVDHYLFGREAGLGFDLLHPGFVSPAPIRHGVDIHPSDIAGEREGPDTRRTLVRRWIDGRVRRRLKREIEAEGAETVELSFGGISRSIGGAAD